MRGTFFILKNLDGAGRRGLPMLAKVVYRLRRAAGAGRAEVLPVRGLKNGQG
jgi:hypothetical protein